MSPNARVIHLITGEYPPVPGGVADYSRLVAEGLAARGIRVVVWTGPSGDRRDDAREGVEIRREAGSWTRADLNRLDGLLDAYPSPRRLLLQFAPNAFHPKGLNFPLAGWLTRRVRRGDRLRSMFHEVTYIVKPGDGWKRRLLAVAQRKVAARVLRASARVDVAIPYWEGMLRPLDPDRARVYEQRPVPSNIPVVDHPEAIREIRGGWAELGITTLLGSFGTYAPDVEVMLAAMVKPVLRDRPDLGLLLIGNGGDRVVKDWISSDPSLMGRILATGRREPGELSKFLQAVDLMVLPYPGGVCGKRGSLMAALAHGRPIVTTFGEVTESFWSETGAAALVSEASPSDGAAVVVSLVADRTEFGRMGEAGRRLYHDRFDLIHTLDSLEKEPI